jgi:hypothetical protein
MKKFKIALIYDSDKRYVFDFDIVQETLKLSDKDIEKLETAVRLELSRG